MLGLFDCFKELGGPRLRRLGLALGVPPVIVVFCMVLHAPHLLGHLEVMDAALAPTLCVKELPLTAHVGLAVAVDDAVVLQPGSTALASVASLITVVSSVTTVLVAVGAVLAAHVATMVVLFVNTGLHMFILNYNVADRRWGTYENEYELACILVQFTSSNDYQN